MLQWLKRNITNRLFTKLLILQSAVVILILGLFLVFVSGSIARLLTRNALQYNRHILKTVYQKVLDQHTLCKDLLTSLFYRVAVEEPSIGDRYAALVTSLPNGALGFDAYTAHYNIVQNYLNRYVMAQSDDLIDLMIIDRQFMLPFHSTQNRARLASSLYLDPTEQILKSQKPDQINRIRLHTLPFVYVPKDKTQGQFYALYDYLREPSNPSVMTGYAVFYFNTTSIRNAYKPFEGGQLGRVLVTDRENAIVFDSENEWTGFSPYPAPTTGAGTDTTRETVDAYLLTQTNGDFRFTITVVIQKSALLADINRINLGVVLMGMVGLIAILFFSSMSTRFFARRTQGLLHTLVALRGGNLKVRSTETGREDELGQIAEGINTMAGQLEAYIEREYIREMKWKETELRQKQAELSALQSQIDPHYLYNTLESIRMRALSAGDSDASQMIKLLAKLFRSSIKDDMFITIERELEYCQSYLELYSIRFGDHLHHEWRIEPEIRGSGIVKHLLQPILENAMLHGLDLDAPEARLLITSRHDETDIWLTVEDNGRGMSPDALAAVRLRLNRPESQTRGSIGIANVHQRISLIYGPDCGVSVVCPSGGGTTVTLHIKNWSREALEAHVQNTDR